MTKFGVIFAAVALSCSGCIAEQNKTVLAARDLYVIDGDTVRFDGASYRLLGFDTPETFQPKCERERVLGFTAKARLRALLDGASNVTLWTSGRSDHYGRQLASLQIDGVDVGDLLISENLARPYRGGQRTSWCN